MVKEEMGDELNLWNAIVEKIKRCRTINDKYDSVVLSGVPAIEQKMQTDSARKFRWLQGLHASRAIYLLYSSHIGCKG